MKQEEVLSKNFFLGVFWHEFESLEGVLSRPALRHLESKLNCLILFMAVMAWYHLCHLLLASIPTKKIDFEIIMKTLVYYPSSMKFEESEELPHRPAICYQLQ